MKNPVRFLALAASAVMVVSPLAAHDVKNMEHTHAFEQTGYGTYRQGHSVNNQLGNITVWSAKPYGSYSRGSTVEFARPEPITRPPSNPFLKSSSKNKTAAQYGKTTKKNYGKTSKKNYGKK